MEAAHESLLHLSSKNSYSKNYDSEIPDQWLGSQVSVKYVFINKYLINVLSN